MATKRTPLRRQVRWQVSPTALQIWRLILELQSQPRDAHGELSEQNEIALRDAVIELAHEVGFCKFTIEPHRIQDEPWPWIHEQVQLERWQEGKAIRDALNAALLAATAAQVPAPTWRRRAKRYAGD